MTLFMNGLTPRYGVPATLSLLIHGLLIAALAAVSVASKVMPTPPTIAIELVEPASPPVEPPPVRQAPSPRIQPVPKPVPTPIKPVTDEPAFSPSEVMMPPSLSVNVGPPPVSRPLPGVTGPARESLLRDPAGEAVSASRARAREGATPAPEYPLVARQAGWEGTVVVQVEVLPDGTAGGVTVYQSSGHPALDQAAVKAVKTWRFVPAMDGNFPVRSLVRIPVKFDLRRS